MAATRLSILTSKWWDPTCCASWRERSRVSPLLFCTVAVVWACEQGTDAEKERCGRQAGRRAGRQAGEQTAKQHTAKPL
jgi:hypothetical protein